jgi:hypothetical protein
MYKSKLEHRLIRTKISILDTLDCAIKIIKNEGLIKGMFKGALSNVRDFISWFPKSFFHSGLPWNRWRPCAGFLRRDPEVHPLRGGRDRRHPPSAESGLVSGKDGNGRKEGSIILGQAKPADPPPSSFLYIFL